MKYRKILFLLLAITFFGGLYILFMREKQDSQTENRGIEENEKIQPGDLIFQTSKSRQSKAIQLATKSKYSHCGIIYKGENGFFVYEAIGPVKRTPLKEWIRRGENGHYVIKRLKNADQVLTDATIEKMKRVGEKFHGKEYDTTFEWSDDKMYCSELVWKIYQRGAGIEIGEIQQLRDFDLTNDIVKQIVNRRYGNNPPWEERVISPVAIYNSALLKTVQTKE